jgi:Domain of unknown function (DUF397)
MTHRKYVKSTRSGGSGGNCVEWAVDGSLVYVRDSKNPTGPELSMTRTEWADFAAAAAGGHGHAWVGHNPSGTTVTKDGHSLQFTAAEWSAFAGGALAGECALVGSPAVA